MIHTHYCMIHQFATQRTQIKTPPSQTKPRTAFEIVPMTAYVIPRELPLAPSHTDSMTPMVSTRRAVSSALVGVRLSMSTASIAVATGIADLLCQGLGLLARSQIQESRVWHLGQLARPSNESLGYEGRGQSPRRKV